MGCVTLEKQGRIAIVRFDRGTRANALSFAAMDELTQIARSFESDAETSAVILTGRADCFSMGFDLKDAATQALVDLPLSERRARLAAGGRMCQAWQDIAPLTICAIEGWCLGGGLALAVSTDLRVADQNAQLALPEIERGLNMSWGSVPRITALIGPARAKQLILLAEQVDAARAADWGLLDAVAPAGGAMDAAHALAARAAQMPPVALRMGKQAINAASLALSGATSHADADQFALALASDDGTEGLMSFREGRPARFTGG